MASTFSFDVVSEYDIQAVRNAVDTAQKEIANRWDLKQAKFATIELKEEKGKEEIVVHAENESVLRSLHEVLKGKLVKQGVDIRIVDWETKPDDATHTSVRQHLALKKGLSGEKAKEIAKAIREAFPKAKPAIQGEAIRVSSASKDELQAVMQMLRGQDYGAPLAFTNYRG